MAESEVNLPDSEDRGLVQRYLEDRDEDAFLAIYRRYTPALYRLALGLTGSEQDAADALQESWLRAARRLPEFRWQSALQTWLSGIVINCCRESWRRDKRPEAGEAAPVHAVSTDEARVDVARAIRDLPDRARAVLLLHEIYGHTHGEIARLLEIDEGTSKSQLSYSRQWMRRWFDQRIAGGNHVR